VGYIRLVDKTAYVSGCTARAMEYLVNNRISRPRSIYVCSFDRE